MYYIVWKVQFQAQISVCSTMQASFSNLSLFISFLLCASTMTAVSLLSPSRKLCYWCCFKLLRCLSACHEQILTSAFSAEIPDLPSRRCMPVVSGQITNKVIRYLLLQKKTRIYSLGQSQFSVDRNFFNFSFVRIEEVSWRSVSFRREELLVYHYQPAESRLRIMVSRQLTVLCSVPVCINPTATVTAAANSVSHQPTSAANSAALQLLLPSIINK